LAELADLYGRVQAPGGEDILSITSSITRLYDDPATLFPLLDLLTSAQNPTIRHAAAIGLRTMLSKFWEQLPHTAPIKMRIIESLTNDPELIVRQEVIHAIGPLFPCEELENLAFEALESDDPLVLQTGIELWIKIFQTLSEDSEPVISPICERLAMVLGSNSDDLRIAGARLIAVLMEALNAPLPTELLELFSELLRLFEATVRAGEPLSWALAKPIGETAEFEELRVDCAVYLDVLGGLLASDISVEQALPVFPILGSLVTRHFIELDVEMGELVGVLFRWLSAAFTDSCDSDQSDIALILAEVSSLFLQARDSIELRFGSRNTTIS
jgi:hypothetical protein